LVGLAFALDAIEILVPFRRQQHDGLEAPAGARTAESPRGVLDRLSGRVLMAHSRSPFAKQRTPSRRIVTAFRSILFHFNTIAAHVQIVSETRRYHGIGLTPPPEQ